MQDNGDKPSRSQDKAFKKPLNFSSVTTGQKKKQITSQKVESSRSFIPKMNQDKNRISITTNTSREVKTTSRYDTPVKQTPFSKTKIKGTLGFMKAINQSTNSIRKRGSMTGETFGDVNSHEIPRVSLKGTGYSDLKEFEEDFQQYFTHTIARRESDYFRDANLFPQDDMTIEGCGRECDRPTDTEIVDMVYSKLAKESKPQTLKKLSTQRSHSKSFTLNRLIEGIKCLKITNEGSSLKITIPKKIPNMVKGVSSSTQETEADLYGNKDELSLKSPSNCSNQKQSSVKGTSSKVSKGINPSTEQLTGSKKRIAHIAAYQQQNLNSLIEKSRKL